MKKSKKLIRITLLIPFIISLVVLIYIRVLISSDFKIDTSYDDYNDENITEKLDYDGFTKLNVRGKWKIEIEQGDEYRIEVEGPEHRVKSVRIERGNHTLYLKDSFFKGHGGSRITVRVQMPDLERLTANGNSKIRLYNLDCDDFDLDLNGSNNLLAINSTFESLDLDCNGSGDVDLTDSKITDAELDLVGSVEVELTMAGGEINGRATGSASVVYYGDVKSQNIRTTGGSSVRKK